VHSVVSHLKAFAMRLHPDQIENIREVVLTR